MMNPSASSIFLFCFLVFLPISQCKSQEFVPMDEKLVEETCSETPYPDICLFGLKFIGGNNREIYSANRTRLADLMIDVVGVRATDALNKVEELLQNTPEDRPLQKCSLQYSYITTTMVPYAKMRTYENPKAAGYLMQGVQQKAGKYCQDLFRGGSSPITDWNQRVQQAAAIAEAIIAQLR